MQMDEYEKEVMVNLIMDNMNLKEWEKKEEREKEMK